MVRRKGIEMIIKQFQLYTGKLQEQTTFEDRLPIFTGKFGESWFDVQDASPEELRRVLTPLDLHPLQLTRCMDSVNDPGVISFGKSLLMEYPAAFNSELTDLAYLSILMKDNILVTIRHGLMPALDGLIQELRGDSAPQLLHLPQIIYMILDVFADLNAEAQVMIRDQILLLSNNLADNPDIVSSNDLSRLRSQVEILVSHVENQLYCISGLNASDNDILQDPHRKAYIQDILSETEITQRGVYHLEARVRDLYNDYQSVGSDRVEKRLRLLTIISAITLPLGLIAGLLGMNVGGIPGSTSDSGFIIVSGLMAVIIMVQYWYFKRRGWFD